MKFVLRADPAVEGLSTPLVSDKMPAGSSPEAHCILGGAHHQDVAPCFTGV